MLPLEVVFAALFGLVFGSFLNVCIVRLPRGGSIVRPPSRCTNCRTPIRPIDNIPLLSWVLLRGRSRCCGGPISLRYPLVEAASAVLAVASLLVFGLNPTGIGMAVFCWLLLGLAWMDAETYLLPDAFTLPGLALGIIYRAVSIGPSSHQWTAAIWHSLLSAAAMGGLLLLVALIYRLIRHREGMGMGDVKLGAMLGAWLGWQLAGIALFLAVVSAAIAGILWALSKRKPSETEEGQAHEPLRLPFGSFLATAGILTVFAGQPVLTWYLRFFL
jgi:leader peptidase (prepilin peptidase) / N-methyltransferase